MPAGVPVATVSIDGEKNAGLLALKILGISDSGIQKKLDLYREDLQKLVEEKNKNLKSSL
jgi:5-(carboxyamino)imidazole ribonucleotide mutase